MRSFTPLRLAAQLCFFGAALCLLAPFRADWPLFALLAPLALLAALPAVGLEKPGPRLALGLLPALALPLASGWISLAAGLAAVIYTAAVLAGGRFARELWEYRREVLTLLALSALIALLSALAGFRSPPSRGLAAACVLLSLSALRALRLGRGGSLAWNAGNLGLFALPLAAGALAGGLLWASVPVLQWLGQGLGAALAWLLVLWNAFWSRAIRRVDTIGDDFFLDETTPPPTNYTHSDWDPEATSLPRPNDGLRLPELRLPWQAILAGLAVLALLILALWLLRRGRRLSRSRLPSERFLEEPEPEAPRRERSRRRRPRAPKTNRARLRALYREYLAFLRLNGVRPGPGDTSGEISRKAAAVLREGDGLLRGLYRKARYSREEISDQELADAQEAFRRLTSKDNLRE